MFRIVFRKRKGRRVFHKNSEMVHRNANNHTKPKALFNNQQNHRRGYVLATSWLRRGYVSSYVLATM